MRPGLRGRWGLFLAMALGLVSGSGCKPAQGPAGGVSAETLPAVPVRTEVVRLESIESVEQVVGTVRSKRRATVEAKVSARIEAVSAIEGGRVRAGELLARLDDREVRASMQQAQAQRDQAEKDLGRLTVLLQQGTVTQSEFDAVQARQRVAVAVLASAEVQLSHATVLAPFDGVVVRKWVEAGDLAGPGRPLVEIEDPEQLRLEAEVPEALIDRIRIGQRLRIRLDSVGVELEGTVEEMAASADPTTRTSRVKVELPRTPGLRSGLFGRVHVPVAAARSLRVASASVIRRGQMELVFVVVEGQARLRLVRTGRVEGGITEILAGLDAGEVVAISGHQGLRDRQPVQVQP